MKFFKAIFSLIALVFTLFSANAQPVGNGSSCDQANCTTGGVYPSITGQTSMGQYGCLYTTPNPYWVAINITQAGDVHFLLTQNTDIDFAAYGPYTSVSAACPITSATPQVDCSYSASGTENVDILNVQPGQVYIILITNYSGAAGNYNLIPQGNSTATFDCNINFSGTYTTTPAVCGQPTGSANVTPTGGFAPYTYYWNNVPGNPTTPNISNMSAGTYTVTITSSPDPVTGFTYTPATVTVIIPNSNPPVTSTISSTTDVCGSGQGSVTVTPTSGVAPYTYNWPALGTTTQTVSNVMTGTYVVQITDNLGCTGSKTVTVGNTPVNYTSATTVVSCPGGNDGTATATMTPALGTVSYLWNDPAGQTTQTATGLTAGTYTCNITSSVGCTGTVTVNVTEIPGMQANFTTITDATCNSLNDGVLGVTVTAGTTPYTYSWDNSTSTANIANDLLAGTHTVTITDAKGCVITRTQAINEPAPLKITMLTPDTQICPENTITLNVTGTGGSSTHTYTWSSNGTVLGTGNSITVDPDVTNTSYCVELSEVCGSPKTDSCMVVTFPTPIPPHITPDNFAVCMPGAFVLTNTSPNVQEVARTYYDFGNYSNQTIDSGDVAMITYNKPGTYTLEVINTSIYGCVYDTVLVDFLTVYPDPIARFALGGNPGTIFETTMTGQDLSTDDVISWKWSSPNSTPSYSDLQYPKFKFPEGIEGKYPVTLIVETQEGCKDTVTNDAIIENVILFYVPNTFTPDGDEFNQSWKFVMKGGDNYGFNLKVFNRWGEMVWETNDPEIGWDGTFNGKPVQQGMYSWRASIKHRGDDGKEEFNGHVNIIR